MGTHERLISPYISPLLFLFIFLNGGGGSTGNTVVDRYQGCIKFRVCREPCCFFRRHGCGVGEATDPFLCTRPTTHTTNNSGAVIRPKLIKPVQGTQSPRNQSACRHAWLYKLRFPTGKLPATRRSCRVHSHVGVGSRKC